MNSQKNTPAPDDLALANAIAGNFLLPAPLLLGLSESQGFARLAAHETVSQDQARRLIAEERLLKSAAVSKTPAFDIIRDINGCKLKCASPVAELFYTALALPSVSTRLPMMVYGDAHNVLENAAYAVGLNSVDLSFDPLHVISPSGMLEGELINAFLERAVKIYKTKTVQNRIERRKRSNRAALRKIREVFSGIQNDYSELDVFELRLFSPPNKLLIDLKRSEKVIMGFCEEALGNKAYRVAAIVRLRCYTASTGFFFRVLVVAQCPSPSACKYGHPINGLARVWLDHGGDGSAFVLNTHFGGNLESAQRHLKLILSADQYVHLAPSAKTPHFAVAHRHQRLTVPFSQPAFNQLASQQQLPQWVR